MGVKISKKPGKVHSAKIGPDQSGVSDEIQVAVGEVVKKYKDGSEDKKSEEVGVVYGPGPFANVGVRAKRTINLGDYNSVQIEVSLHCPSTISEKEINETFGFVSGWVDDRMQEICEKLEPSNKTNKE